MNDAKLIFDDDRALTAVGSCWSTNLLNFGIGKDAFDGSENADPGASGRLWLEVRITTAFVCAAAPTTANLLVQLYDCATASGTYAQMQLYQKITGTTNLTAGTLILNVPLPQSIKQYAKLYYTVAGCAFTAGKVWAGIVQK
jgi:hypothetical protein